MSDVIKQPMERYSELLVTLSDARKKLDSVQTSQEAISAINEILSIVSQSQKDDQFKPIMRLLSTIMLIAESVATFDCTRQMLSSQINEAEVILKKLNSNTHSAAIVIFL